MKTITMYRMVVLASMVVPSIALLSAILSNECVMMSFFTLGALVALAGHRLTHNNPLEEEKNGSGLFWLASFLLPIWSVRTYEPSMSMLIHYYITLCIIAVVVCAVGLAMIFLKKRNIA